MTKKVILAITLLLAGLVAGVSSAEGSEAAPVYYVALGDSLATGAQPTPSGQTAALRAANGTNSGYVDVLYDLVRERTPNLHVKNFGCGGESTTSMIEGGFPFDYRCGYGPSSQLAEAVAFLQEHRGQVAFVTVDIGANDLFTGGAAAIAVNLPVILAQVRAAAGPDVPIVGMNYYDPFVAPIWFSTHDLAAVAAEAASLRTFNDFVEGVYATAGVPVADADPAPHG
jgi:lysophospholipase L1-like esterase